MASFAETDQGIVLLAGPTDDLSFPPRLNTEVPASELNTAETPDAYGLDLEADGVIAKSTVPSSTSRVQKSVTIGAETYYWHYDRLWRFTGTELMVGAMSYDAIWLRDGHSLYFNEDSGAILAIVPFGRDNMMVMKATGSYVIENCFDTRGPLFFNRGPMIQELAPAAATKVIEIDGLIYAANATGIFAYDGRAGKVEEVTRLIRGGTSTWWNAALTADYNKKRVVAGTGLAMVGTSAYRYSGSTFRYTTPELRNAEHRPIAVQTIIFVVRHPSTAIGTLTYQCRVEGTNWTPTKTIPISYESGAYTIVRASVPSPCDGACRRFQLRITDITGSKQIERILVDVEAMGFDGSTQ